MSDQLTRQFVATYGVKQMRGGVLVTEQMIIDAESIDVAWRLASHRCKRGEFVYNVDPIKQLETI